MYADRIEAEVRSVRTRLTGNVPEEGGFNVGGVRGRVSFKRTGGGGGGGGGGPPKTRGRGSADEKWQHDLFEQADLFLQPKGDDNGDLRALLASKQQAKLGAGRLGGRLGGGGGGGGGGGAGSNPGLNTARATVAAAATDLRQNLVGGGRRRPGRPGVRRKPVVVSTSSSAAAAAVAAASARKRITVTLRNDGVDELEEGDYREEEMAVPAPAVVRGGRGSLIVTSSARDEEDEMEMDGGAMPGQTAVPATRQKFQSRAEAVSSFLSSLGLSKYTSAFAAEEIDMPALAQMTEEDLKELGIPMGPRKKIIVAAAAI